MLKLFESSNTVRVSTEHTKNYQTFDEHFHDTSSPQELKTFERFYASRSLLENGLDVFLDPEIGPEDGTAKIHVDACGIHGQHLTIMLCETSQTSPSIFNALRLVSESNNAKAVILAPTAFDTTTLEETLHDAISKGTISVEHLGWFDERLDQTLQETLRLVELLGNETRMRMLAPLFRRASAKREYRTTINPKLVYKNLEVLLEARLVDENEQGYQLSYLGKGIVAEFITFLEKARKTLNTTAMEKEVKEQDE